MIVAARTTVMEVTQDQIDRWRTLFDQVSTGLWEIEAARRDNNEAKIAAVLNYLAASALSAGAEMERLGARQLPAEKMLIDRHYHSEAANNYLAALKAALNAAYWFEEERFAEAHSRGIAPMSNALAMLLDDAERTIHWRPAEHDCPLTSNAFEEPDPWADS